MFSAPREPPRKHESVFRAGAIEMRRPSIFSRRKKAEEFWVFHIKFIRILNFLFGMIAGINNNADINSYLEAEEIERLPRETIEGVLIDIRKPKRQGTLTISVGGEGGIKVDDKDYWVTEEGFRVVAIMTPRHYQELRERAMIGVRIPDKGKFHVYDLSRLDTWRATEVKNLESYRDNKQIA